MWPRPAKIKKRKRWCVFGQIGSFMFNLMHIQLILCQLYLQSIVILYTLVGGPNQNGRNSQADNNTSGYIISYYFRWGCIRYTILYYTLKDVRNQTPVITIERG